MSGKRLLRLAGCAIGLAGLIVGFSACLAPSRLPADEALALSTSALAGVDRYSFAGETVVRDAGGAAVRQPFSGEVAGHRLAALSWGQGKPEAGIAPAAPPGAGQKGGAPAEAEAPNPAAHGVATARTPPAAAPTNAASLAAGRPLALAELAPLQAAAVAYERSDDRGAVVLKFALRPEAAKARAADHLCSREGSASREALDSLQASTVCSWTADRRTWFPTELKEETVLRYTSGGRPITERRTTVLHFRRKPDGAIIEREEGR